MRTALISKMLAWGSLVVARLSPPKSHARGWQGPTLYLPLGRVRGAFGIHGSLEDVVGSSASLINESPKNAKGPVPSGKSSEEFKNGQR